jgi:hypothetical protein
LTDRGRTAASTAPHLLDGQAARSITLMDAADRMARTWQKIARQMELAGVIERSAESWATFAKLAQVPDSLTAVSRLSEQIAGIPYLQLQNRWLDTIPQLQIRESNLIGVELVRQIQEISDATRAQIIGSTAARQIQEIVQSYNGLGAAATIRSSLADLPLENLNLALNASWARLATITTDATNVALLDWANRLRDRAERDADGEIRRQGWWGALPSWSIEDLVELADHAASDGKVQFSKRLCGMYRRNRMRLLRRMVDGWMDEPSFRSRRAIIYEALASHRDGRYKVVIPALLPLVEGITDDEFPRPPYTSVPASVRDALDQITKLHEIETGAMLSALSALYQSYSKDDLPRRARTLNRHAISHGYSLGYGTEANSLRVFGILDLLHSQVQTRKELSESAA